MTHHIKHPQNWLQLEDLHNYLWKRFPMDRFDFIESSGESSPVYSGTSLPVDPFFIPIRGEQPKVAFFDDVSEAIDDFVRKDHREWSSEHRSEETPRFKIA